MKTQIVKEKARESGIEALKIVAIIMIIMSHVAMSLESKNDLIQLNYKLIDLNAATADVQYLMVKILAYGGSWGNIIFFVCSSWFLLERKKSDCQKWFFMYLENWLISIIILLVIFFIRQGNIATNIVIKSIFPNVFANNWYITCYLLFYPITPALNGVIERMNQITLFRTCLVMLVIYFGFNFIKWGSFFSSHLILWIAGYFIVAYMKFYLKGLADNRKYNILLLMLGLFGHFGIIILTNFLGLQLEFLGDKGLLWCVNSNPFLLISSIAMFNLARSIHFKNGVVNYISKLSLLIYIIHENIILRTYCRPYLIASIYENYGLNQIFFKTIYMAFVIFIFALTSAVIYERLLQNKVLKLSEFILKKICKLYNIFENFILRLH